MNCMGFKKMLAVGVAIFGLALCAMPASAGWGCRGGCCGGCGGWYGGYASCGYGCCGCGYGWGGGGWGWGGCSGGCYGCGYGWGGGGWGSYGYGLSSYCSSCGGTLVAYSGGGCSSCGGGQSIAQPADMPSTPPAVPPTPPGMNPPNRTSIESPDGGSIMLTVWVPSDAKVTINGATTKSTGGERHFVSYGVRPRLYLRVQDQGGDCSRRQDRSGRADGFAHARQQRVVAFHFSVPSSERLAATE